MKTDNNIYNKAKEVVISKIEQLENEESNLTVDTNIYDNINVEEAKVRLIKTLSSMQKSRAIRLRNRIISISVAAAIMFITLIVYSERDEKQVLISGITLSESVIAPILITSENVKINLDEVDRFVAEAENIGKNEITFTEKKEEKIEYNTIVIPTQQTYKINLHDGSVVTLNSGSSLTFPKNFSGNERVVTLKGEAYFDVAKSNKQFIVKIDGGVDVKVYGTQFNVNARNTKEIKTVLIEGSVGVNFSDILVMIEPSELATVNTSQNDITVSEVNSESYIDWLNNKFVVKKEPLSQLFDKIAIWYGVDFVLSSNVNLDRVVSVNLKKYDDISELLEFLEISMGVKFHKMRDNEYGVERNKE